MKRNNKILPFILSLCIILGFAGCVSQENERSLKLQIYECAAGDDGLVLNFVDKYNKSCSAADKIEIVQFDTQEKMLEKLSTEMMAGRGPDVISLNADLSIEKLCEQGLLADINELINSDTSKDKLNMEDFNSVVMNAGVKNGKRFAVPFFYTTDILLSKKEALAEFNIPTDKAITYTSMAQDFKLFINNPGKYKFMFDDSSRNHLMRFFYIFLDSYVDFDNKTEYFATEEFRKSLETVGGIVKSFRTPPDEEILDYSYDNYLFNDFTDVDISTVMWRYADFKTNGLTPCVMQGISRDKETKTAFVQAGVAINNNSKLKDKAYKFIKYVLSEKMQLHFCGAGRHKYSYNLPVRTSSYKRLIKIAEKEKDENGEKIGINNEYMQTYFKLAEGVNTCLLPRTHYNSSVIGKPVEAYLTDKLSADRFAKTLSSSTQIYFDE